jgi:hypothetical protein
MRHPLYKTYLNRNKAGRAWITTILDSATSVTKVEIDLVSDERTSEKFPVDLLRKFIFEIDGRDACVYEVSPNEFVYLSGGNRFGATRYVIRTYAFDVTDLPEVV